MEWWCNGGVVVEGEGAKPCSYNAQNTMRRESPKQRLVRLTKGRKYQLQIFTYLFNIFLYKPNHSV